MLHLNQELCMWNRVVKCALSSYHVLQPSNTVPATQSSMRRSPVVLRFWLFVLTSPKWGNHCSFHTIVAPPVLALETLSTHHLRPKVPEEESSPRAGGWFSNTAAGTASCLAKDWKREGHSFSAVSSYSENGPWWLIANICSARLYTGRTGGVAGDCLQSQTTKQERFTVEWQWRLHLLVLPRDQIPTSQMLTLRGFNQAQCFEVFFWALSVFF